MTHTKLLLDGIHFPSNNLIERTPVTEKLVWKDPVVGELVAKSLERFFASNAKFQFDSPFRQSLLDILNKGDVCNGGSRWRIWPRKDLLWRSISYIIRANLRIPTSIADAGVTQQRKVKGDALTTTREEFGLVIDDRSASCEVDFFFFLLNFTW